MGPIIFCKYTLRLSAILTDPPDLYHIYLDDTQLYCTFDVDSSTDALALVEICARDIRSWMIANKLKINKLNCRTERAPLKILTLHSIVIVHKSYSANFGFVTGCHYRPSFYGTQSLIAKWLEQASQ